MVVRAMKTDHDLPIDAVLVHELGHAIVAHTLGLDVEGLRLPTVIFAYPDDRHYLLRGAAQTFVHALYADATRTTIDPTKRNAAAITGAAGIAAEHVVFGGDLLREFHSADHADDVEMIVRALPPSARLAVEPPGLYASAIELLQPYAGQLRSALPPVRQHAIAHAPCDITWTDLRAIARLTLP